MNMKYVKTPSIIEKETGRKFVDICRELLDQGLSPTEIALKLELKDSSRVKNSIRNEKLTNKENILYPEIRFKKLSAIEKLFPKLSEGIEFKDFIYQKYIVEGLSLLELESILGLTSKTLHSHVTHYGFNKTNSEARRDAMRKGVIDYTEIARNTRRTKMKSNTRSNQQEMARDLFKIHIEDYLITNKINNYEVVIGFNEWGILKNKEIDIPIIIINLNDNSFIKIAVEYNGTYWHELVNCDDQQKEIDSKQAGWRHFIIEDHKSNNLIEQRVIEIVSTIMKDLK